ncbi:unnamed protein product [Paramecium octaurelia]|uniref:Uncharacterized protein n=1 Tax=Paramecium octaurelia TaxID=43137 RepID=A0A8S1VQ76_PAROT|nr:unnamed protein product [Paramecium octaurelia]
MKPIFVALYLILHLQLVINIPCECAHIKEEQQCNNSQKCLWNVMVEKCIYQKNIGYNNEMTSYCSQFIEEECILSKRCAFHLGKCQDFTKCDSLLKDKCSQSSIWCISNGQSCIPKSECQEYYNREACQNKNIHGKYCVWKTTNNQQQRCQDIESCEDLPLSLLTDNECREQLHYCTTSIQGGCIRQKDNCYEYVFQEQCYLISLNIKCFWEEESQQCLEKKCSNKLLRTHEQCSQFLPNCTTNGIHCIERLSCHLYQFQSGCIRDNQGMTCVYYQGRCYSKTCDQAPYTVKSMIQCQLFQSESQECVPKRNGGCMNKPNLCNQLETQDACQIVTQNDGDLCFWINQQSICKVKECVDAPLNFDHDQCISWLHDYECIGSLGNGCIQNVENCNQIKNLKSCVKNKNKKKCVIENGECVEEECFNFKYPLYDSHQKCQDRMSLCIYNYLNKSCVNKECQNLSEKDCNYDFNFNKCFLPSGCAHKRCELAQLSKNSYEDCQNWDVRCTINIVVINNEQFIYGCITQYLDCNQYKYQQQCRSTLQGIQCYWNLEKSECEFQTCNNAPISFNTINQCQEWVKYHNQKCVNKQNGGCIEQFPLCEQLTEELQCNIGSLNSLCYWNTQMNYCEKRTCMNASNGYHLVNQINLDLDAKLTLVSMIYVLMHQKQISLTPMKNAKLGIRNALQNLVLHVLINQNAKTIYQKKNAKLILIINLVNGIDYPGTPLEYKDCFLFSNICTISTQMVECRTKQPNCSSYLIREDCNVNLDGDKCSTIGSTCVEVKNQPSSLSHNCNYEDLSKGFLYQYYAKMCIESPQSCNSLTENDCQQLTTRNNELCSWDGTQCLMITSNSQVDCRNQISLTQVECKNYSNICELDFIQFARCTYSTCGSVQEHQCNFITLNRNVQCTWNSQTCQVRTCFNMNEEFTSTYQCILWLDSCTYDQSKKACVNRRFCSQESEELLCAKASYFTSNQQKIYCYWNVGICTDITDCSQISNSTSHRMCSDKLSTCTSLTTSRTAQCIEAPLFCNQIQEKSQCFRNSKYELCQWINGQCWQKRCSLGGRQKPETYISCQRNPRSPFCVFNQQTGRCEEFTKCQFIPNLRQNERNCAKYSSLCRINEQYNTCIRNTKCTQATTYYQYNCDLFLLHRKCRRKKYNTSCQPLAQTCSNYNIQRNCFLDYEQKKCYWKTTSNKCVNFSCSEIDQEVKTHQDCQSISSNCTISIVNLQYSCIDLLKCNQYLYEYQCVIDQNNQVCSWIDDKCILDNCKNSAKNTVYDIQLCEQYYGSNCTINEDRSGCIFKQKMCKYYNQFQCLTPDQKNLFGESCFWDQLNQICSETICDSAPSHFNQLIECQSYNYNCQPSYCRLAKCQDFKYDRDNKCSMTLSRNQCTSNGFRCIERKLCENATNIQACTYSIDYLDCQWMEEENRCVLKSCISAPIYYQTHLDCQKYFQGCTAKANGGCITITTCNSIQTQEGCQQDQFKANCLWDDGGNQCIYLQCETLCGDGIVGGDEKCDDGNIQPYDGCYKCQIQCQYGCDICTQKMCQDCSDGYELHPNGLCYEICGDGIIIGQEECEDMNDIQQDGCFNCRFQCQQSCIVCAQGICLICEYGWDQYNNQCRSVCGNGQIVQQYEQCDDGNNDNFDGCDSNCQVEKDWICNQSDVTGLSECINQVAPKFQLQNISQKKDKTSN